MASDILLVFNAGTLNVGGSLRDRITDIAYLFAATNMNYLCLQDTRQTKREDQAIATTISDLLKPPSSTPATLTPHQLEDNSSSADTAGATTPTTGTLTPPTAVFSLALPSQPPTPHSVFSAHTGRCHTQTTNTYLLSTPTSSNNFTSTYP